MSDIKESIRNQKIQGIAVELSAIHKDKTTDLRTLCFALNCSFDRNNPKYLEVCRWQIELFGLCHERGDAWTKREPTKEAAAGGR